MVTEDHVVRQAAELIIVGYQGSTVIVNGNMGGRVGGVEGYLIAMKAMDSLMMLYRQCSEDNPNGSTALDPAIEHTGRDYITTGK